MNYSIGLDDIVANDDPITFASAVPSHDYGGDYGGFSSGPNAQISPAGAPTYPPHVPGATKNPRVKPRQLSDKEWEDLKDILHTHYIQENKTVEKIIEIMREHDTLLTKRQLITRFNKWKFKKNVKRAEIESFLQKTESTSGQAHISVEGVRISAAKRGRWEKMARTNPSEGLRSPSASQQLSSGDAEGSVETFSSQQYEGESAGHVSLNNPDIPLSHLPSILSPKTISPMARHDTSDIPSSQSPSTLSKKTISPMASLSTLSPNTISPMARNESSDVPSSQSPSTLSPKTIGPMASSSTLSPNTINLVVSGEPSIGQEKTSQLLLPDSPWPLSSKSGDAEPLLLSRLFSALSLAPPSDLTPFCQSATATEITMRDPETISNVELIDLSNGGGGETSSPSTQMTVHTVDKPSLRKRTASSAFKFSDMDAIFPSQTIVFASSLSGELYPFPGHEETRFEARSISKYHDVLRLEMQECKEKINKIETYFPGNNPAVITLIDKLAVAYFGLGNYDEAEKQFKRILPILVQRHGSNSRHFISVKRDLSEVVLHLGRYTEANQLAQEVHTSALGIDNPGGPLVQKSLQVLAQSYGNLRELEKEEQLLRELVQIRLVAFGPRHGDTLAAIRSLSDSIIDSQRYFESEELLRVALELSQGAQGLSDRRKCLIFRKLATVLYKQGNYPESESLYRTTAEMSERFLGSEHPDTLRCRFWLCKVLRARGSLEESHMILQQTVERQIETRGELRGSTIESMADLSTLLLQMERMDEAEMWMKRALRCSQRIGGVTGTRAVRFSDDLARLREGPKHYLGATALFEDMGQEICTLVGPGSRSIEEMSGATGRR